MNGGRRRVGGDGREERGEGGEGGGEERRAKTRTGEKKVGRGRRNREGVKRREVE